MVEKRAGPTYEKMFPAWAAMMRKFVLTQEDSTMKAYEWIIWSIEDGKRTGIEGRSEQPEAHKNAENAKLAAWCAFAAGEEYDPDDYEVEVCPFGG